MAILLACASCESEPQHGFTIAAPEQFAGAAVFLDGRQLGQMQHLETHGGAYEEVLKRIYGDSPAFRVVVINVDLSNGLSPGRHTLRVEKQGLPAAQGEITYPFAADEEWNFFYVDGGKIAISE